MNAQTPKLSPAPPSGSSATRVVHALHATLIGWAPGSAHPTLWFQGQLAPRHPDWGWGRGSPPLFLKVHSPKRSFTPFSPGPRLSSLLFRLASTTVPSCSAATTKSNGWAVASGPDPDLGLAPKDLALASGPDSAPRGSVSASSPHPDLNLASASCSGVFECGSTSGWASFSGLGSSELAESQLDCFITLSLPSAEVCPLLLHRKTWFHSRAR